MVNHTQTIRWLLQTNCLSGFGHLMGLALKGLNVYFGLSIGIETVKPMEYLEHKYINIT